MILTGGRQRFLCGMWVLAALLVLWAAAFTLFRMYAEAMAETAPELKETRELERRVEMAAGSRKSGGLLAADGALAASRLQPPFGDVFAPAPAMDATTGAAAAKKEIVLPKLSGLLITQNAAGLSSHLAIVDGQVVGVRGRVNGFELRAIKADGVTLSRDGQSWFVKTATPAAYSVTMAMDRTATPTAAEEAKTEKTETREKAKETESVAKDKDAKPDLSLPSLLKKAKSG